MIHVFDYLTDKPTLEGLIIEAGLPFGPRFKGVWVTDSQTLIETADAPSVTENAIVQLAAAKADALFRCHLDCQSFIYRHYPPDRQTSFAMLLIEGLIKALMGEPPMQNRFVYIMAGFAWARLSIDKYYEYQAQILACTLPEQVVAIAWDFTINEFTDPKITLGHAASLTS